MSDRIVPYTARLAALLAGGRDEVRETGHWHRHILEGLEFAAVENVKALASLTDAELARLLGIGEATLRRARASGATLDGPTSDRLYRLSKIIALAEEVMEGVDNAMSWLRRPQPGLGGEVPLDLLVTQAGADEVEALLRRIDYGVYS
ncbi:MAG TPA: antitoxin Xre/MbcA/ParS toxin-binding domain-containing protein [Gammaproteobacteria bacterium]|nr:antitoxin Xre/MbcA/ParS toxin-binding domain-containing protein [Gammaproteobacteria bacterium]